MTNGLGSGRISKFVHRKNGGNSCGAAVEDSPRREPWECGLEIGKPQRGARKCSGGVLSPLRGSFFLIPLSHGLRRGLPSAATPWLKDRSKFEMRPNQTSNASNGQRGQNNPSNRFNDSFQIAFRVNPDCLPHKLRELRMVLLESVAQF